MIGKLHSQIISWAYTMPSLLKYLINRLWVNSIKNYLFKISKQLYMQSLMKVSLLSILVLFMVACGAKSDNKDLQKKKEKLEKLKKEQAETTAEIKKLEADIAKLDTTNKKVDKA